MPASNFMLSNGATVTITPPGVQVAINIGQPKQISFSGSKLDLEDITNLASTGNYKEWAPTTLDAGNAALTCVYDAADAGQTALIAAFDARTLLTVIVQYPKGSDETTDGPKQTFSAYVAERPSRSLAVNKIVDFTTQLRINGPITEVAGS
jgi:hypothetical protein